MAFRLTIETDNAAFGETDLERRIEVARILKSLIERLKEETPYRDGWQFFDVNGNKVAEAEFTND